MGPHARVPLVREDINAKAERLLAAGRVRVLPGQRVLARVDGDHGTYRVTAAADEVLHCSCTAGAHGVHCSHTRAVEMVLLRRGGGNGSTLPLHSNEPEVGASEAPPR